MRSHKFEREQERICSRFGGRKVVNILISKIKAVNKKDLAINILA